MRDARRRRPARSPRRPAADLSPRHARRRGVAARARRRGAPSPASSFGPRAAAAAILGAWARPGLRVLVLCVELSAAVVLLTSPAFAAGDVSVSGIHHLTRDQVLRLTDLEGRHNVFLVTSARVEEALRADPYVRGVTVRVALPDQVAVSVDEWEPLALVHRDGRDYLLGSAGNVLGPAAGVVVGRGDGQPKVELTWAAPGPLAPGSQALSGRLLVDLQRIEEAFPSVYGLNVKGIDLTADQQLTISTREGPRILFGQMVTGDQVDSLDAKLGSLKSLASRVDLAHSNLDYVNLMNSNQPVTRAVPSPSPSPRPSASPKR